MPVVRAAPPAGGSDSGRQHLATPSPRHSAAREPGGFLAEKVGLELRTVTLLVVMSNEVGQNFISSQFLRRFPSPHLLPFPPRPGFLFFSCFRIFFLTDVLTVSG